MMVLHKGTLEDLFLILLYCIADTKFPPCSIFSRKYRAQSGAADEDGHSEIPEASLFPVTEHVRNLGQLTYSLCTLAIPL